MAQRWRRSGHERVEEASFGGERGGVCVIEGLLLSLWWLVKIEIGR